MWINSKNHRVVGAALAAVRAEAGLSQVELADLLSKPQSFVSNYESGQRRIDLLEFVTIVRAMGRDPTRVVSDIFKTVLGKLPAAQSTGRKRAVK